MLFTDFDASDKGRPAAMVTDNQEDRQFDFLNAPIPTIEEIASNLEFDFEDDAGGGREEPAPPGEIPISFFPRTDDEDYIPDVPPPSSKPHAPSVERPNDTERAYDAPEEESEPTSKWRRSSDARPTLEEYTRVFPKTSMPSRPSEAWNDSDTFDILSRLPPRADGADAFDGDPDEEWRGKHLGVPPPRSIPYGGIKRLQEWYRPPENASTPPSDPNEEWYEPPESDSGAAIPSGGTTARFNRAPGHNTTSLDLFSDLDLDALWEEKLRQAQSGRSGPDKDTTGIVDMFDGIDLESVWREKQRRRDMVADGDAAPADVAGRHAPMMPSVTDPSTNASTLILDSGLFDNQSTKIIAPDPAPPTGETKQIEPRKKSAVGPTERKTRKTSPPSPKAEADAVGFLEDLGEFFGEKKEPKTTGKSGKTKVGAPTTLDELELEDLIDASDENDEKIGKAVGHSMEEADTEVLAGMDEAPRQSGKRQNTADSFLEGLDYDKLDPGIDDSVQAPVIGDDALDATDPDLDAGTDASEEPPEAGHEQEEENPEPPPAGMAFDAFDMVDDPAVNADVQAPVIDDTAIRTARPKTRSQSSEASSDKPESAQIDASPEPDGEPAEDGEAAVEVDPMDVFANMSDMDFSDDDGLDDEMKAALLDDAEPEEGEGEGDADAVPAQPETPPGTLSGKISYYAGRGLRRVIPASLLQKITKMVAWRENWWFYFDIAAAIIASASLAVIISYYVWYRE